MCLFLVSTTSKAQQKPHPSIAPAVTVLNDDGSEDSLKNEPYSAPLHIVMRPHATDAEGWSATYQWLITKTNDNTQPLDRYIDLDETDFEFAESGTYTVVCYAVFVNGSDTIYYNNTESCVEGYTPTPVTITVAESFLEFPNAFSPNGDSHNDTYGPKGLQEGSDKTKAPKSIVEYHMSIYNRWGQRLFDTHDIYDPWDGTYNGRDVKEGVYYVVCTAKGSDGIKYNIKKDVNLLRGKRESESVSSSSTQ